MYKHTFDLGSTPLEVTTEKVINKNILDTIFELVQYIRYDFNHTIHNSSGYRFNTGKDSVPFLVSKEFTHYLKVNRSLKSKFFNPFYILDGKKKKSFDSNFEFFHIEENTIIKDGEYFFNTQLLLESYLSDIIFDFLVDNNLKGFLLSTNNFYRSDKKKSWDILNNLEDHDIKINENIQNETVGVVFNNRKDPKENIDIFGVSDHLIDVDLIILKEKSFINTKMKGLEILKIQTESGLNHYAKKHGINFKIVDSESNLIEFPKKL